jgi:putative beta-barrel porin BBP2
MRRAPDVTKSSSTYPGFAIRVAVIAILVRPGSGQAVAQEKDSERSKYGSVRLGPVYLSARAPFAVGVDGNVYNTPEGTSDEAASITPTLKAVLPLGRHARIRSSGGVVPQYFHRESTQRYTDRFGDVRGEIDAGPITAYGGIGGGRFRQRFTLEIDDRLERHEKSDVLGAVLHVGHRVTVGGSQTRLTSTFDAEAIVDGRPVSASLDRRTMTRRADLSLPLTRKTSLRPFADFVEDRFLQPSPGLASSVTSQRYGAALAFSELAFLNGTLAAGVRHFGAGEGVAPYDGLFLSVNVTSPFIVGTRLLLSANRDVNYSAVAARSASVRNTYVASNYRAEVSFELPLRLHGRVFGGYIESRYLRPSGDEATFAPRRDRGWLEGAALLRHLGRHLSLGGRVQHESRTSPLDGRSYDGLAYGLAGEVRF